MVRVAGDFGVDRKVRKHRPPSNHIQLFKGFSKRLRALSVPAALLVASSTTFANATDLYSATVIVTGCDNLAERSRGIREALPLVLSKLTADPELARLAVEKGLSVDAETLVEKLAYADRKEGVQISDEQGTRERSFELTVSFDAVRIGEIVEELGGSAWTGERPQIGVALRVDDGSSAYLLTRSSEKGYGQRLALQDEAAALALPVTLPETGEAADLASPVRLAGEMTITPAGYWDTRWRLEAEGLDESFGFDDTTFDAAIGGALRHSAKLLAKR